MEQVWDETLGFVYLIRMPGDSDSGGRCTSKLSVLHQHRGSGFYPLAKPDQEINGIGQTMMDRARIFLPGSELKEYLPF